eukprot:CAMPEP_0114335598 /NCGR_PEP_ID=MMETSP0101-20121206/5156_1 /TAXON_ID=38822 ORGANISM="Pteridomonas danica, Strain PT" /NCGR_SAMPLE_ID=MMETSP0101 /ASSEMBLY_ACC=CAM_ASM_000211 /LENGTH=338 /DNA_ID=CAMNT_0001467259 /DNA_START=915 /DNA_END=1932 /DNA_ORIENTATION=-
MYDLLNERSELTALEDGNGVLQLVGLTQHACDDIDEFLETTNEGRSARTTAATGANATSSRSHCAMLVRVYKNNELLGKLSLIDLGGAERGADNENTDSTTRKEGRDINTSLLALKEVIRALQNGKHAPFRQSRLTQVLEESLTGEHCKTVLIACVSGAQADTQQSINTLRYAQDLYSPSSEPKPIQKEGPRSTPDSSQSRGSSSSRPKPIVRNGSLKETSNVATSSSSSSTTTQGGATTRAVLKKRSSLPCTSKEIGLENDIRVVNASSVSISEIKSPRSKHYDRLQRKKQESIITDKNNNKNHPVVKKSSFDHSKDKSKLLKMMVYNFQDLVLVMI